MNLFDGTGAKKIHSMQPPTLMELAHEVYNTPEDIRKEVDAKVVAKLEADHTPEIATDPDPVRTVEPTSDRQLFEKEMNALYRSGYRYREVEPAEDKGYIVLFLSQQITDMLTA